MKQKPYHQRIREKYLPQSRQLNPHRQGERIAFYLSKKNSNPIADTYTGLLEQNLISGVWKDE